MMCRYWLEEFHFDGYRFDFTKGFTNYAPGGSVDGFDQSRINILKRMADKIWQIDPKAYIILEHWSPDAEETQLGNYGMKMWRNKSYLYVPAAIGNPTGSFAGMDATSHVAFYNSHDKEELQNTVLQKAAHRVATISKILSCLKELNRLLRLIISNPDQK